MNAEPRPSDRQRAAWLTIVLWVVQILLAAFFLFVQGIPKLIGSVDAVRLFDDIGLGQWLRYLTGVLEVVGALGLLIPRVAGPAALGLLGVMVGATISNLFLAAGYETFAIQTVALGVIFALIAWVRRSEFRGLVGR